MILLIMIIGIWMVLFFVYRMDKNDEDDIFDEMDL